MTDSDSGCRRYTQTLTDGELVRLWDQIAEYEQTSELGDDTDLRKHAGLACPSTEQTVLAVMGFTAEVWREIARRGTVVESFAWR